MRASVSLSKGSSRPCGGKDRYIQSGQLLSRDLVVSFISEANDADPKKMNNLYGI